MKPSEDLNGKHQEGQEGDEMVQPFFLSPPLLFSFWFDPWNINKTVHAFI